MATDTLRMRVSTIPEPLSDSNTRSAGKIEKPRPVEETNHGSWQQYVRIILFAAWFNGCCIAISVTQFIGAPLYFYNRDYFYAFMAYTKQSFWVALNNITVWFSPTVVRVSWDAGLRGQFKRAKDGRLESQLPERIVLMANHQIYTDWLYLWWFAYTSKMHGHLFIILRDNLRYIPILGPGMMFFGFIFMSRKWVSDKPRLQYRLQKLKTRHSGPMAGSASQLDPMWLMIFPEGTNLSANTRKRSAKWAETSGIPDLHHALLPRSTGLHFCLNELKGTVDYIYDCTTAYEGTPEGGYAQDIFTLRSTWFRGSPPKSVNMYWRRFAVVDIPIDDDKAFEAWLLNVWREKDELLEQYHNTGRFPAGTEGVESGMSNDDYIETQVGVEHWWETGQIFAVLAALALVANVCAKLYTMFFSR